MNKSEMIKILQSVLTPSEKYDWDVYGEIFVPVNREDCESGYLFDYPKHTVHQYFANSVEEYCEKRKEVISDWNSLREKHGGLFVRRFPTLDFNVTEESDENKLPENIKWIFSFRICPKNP